jgi:DNA-binding transcriptional LysR family regulator
MIPNSSTLANAKFAPSTLIADNCVVRHCSCCDHEPPSVCNISAWSCLRSASLRGAKDKEAPNITYEAPTFESEFQAVASGKGISITPIAASRFYARPGLVFPKIRDMPLCVVSIALPKRASPLAREFSQVAIALAQSYQSQPTRDAKSAADDIIQAPEHS